MDIHDQHKIINLPHLHPRSYQLWWNDKTHTRHSRGWIHSKECNERKDTPAKCALCGGSHPANYKSCEQYHNLLKGNNIYGTPPIRTPPLVTTTHGCTTPLHNSPRQQGSYADVTKSHEHQVEDTATSHHAKNLSRRIQRTVYTTTPTKQHDIEHAYNVNQQDSLNQTRSWEQPKGMQMAYNDIKTKLYFF